MTKVGIIAEYNPFHNGHIYHLNKAKEMFKDASFVLILIGNFTQRGDASIINKWNKAKIALEYGYDLVVELPFNIATSSANIYAKGAIDLLNNLDCNYLVFGSETNDINLFKKIALLTENNKDYENKIKYYLNMGYNYPKACSLALNNISNIIIDKPNDVLGLEYVKSIIKSNSKIIPISIKRTNDYNDNKISNEIASASSIRSNINNKDLIKNTMPEICFKYINNIDEDKLFILLKHQIIINDNLKDILDVDEGIENKLKKEIYNCNNINELIISIKSKRYSYNRLKRMLLHILTNTKKDYDNNINYIRVLGFTNNGKKILKEAKKITNLPIITKYQKKYDYLFKADVKAAKIYSLLTNYNHSTEFNSPIKKYD